MLTTGRLVRVRGMIGVHRFVRRYGDGGCWAEVRQEGGRKHGRERVVPRKLVRR